MTALSIAKELVAPEVDLIPVAHARPVLTPPKNVEKPEDAKTLFVWLCQHCYELHEETIEPTLSPWLTHCPGCTDPATRPVVLVLGQALWVGPHLLRGYPDDLDRVLNMLWRLAADDLKNGLRHRWLLSPPTADEPTPQELA